MENMKALKEESCYDVIVLGAGISGLTAAYNIKKRDPGSRVIVLEGKDRVGGRTVTVPLVSSKGTDHWDLGGQWVGRCQVHVIRLLKELGLETYEQYIKGKKLQQLGETKVRTYTSDIPNLSIWALLDLQWFMTKISYYQKQLSIEDPFSHPRAAEWDAMSLGAYLDKTLYTLGAREANDAATRCILGCETTQVSFLYYLLYVAMAGGIKNLIEATDHTAQEYRIKGGAQQISQRLAERLGKGAVRLGDAVISVAQTDTEVAVTTSKGWKGYAPYVILAMPPKALEHVEFSPSLSDDRVDFIKRMPMGNMIKIIITYETAFWRSKGFSGEAVSDGGEITVPGCSRGPLCITYDATSANNCPALVGFVGGDAAVDWAKQTAKIRQKAILEHFATFLGPEVHTFLDYIEKDWNQEPFSWGGPVSYLTSGSVERFSQVVRRPEGRLHFAGTETATSWSGYMSGAIQAGERCALEVLHRAKPSALSETDIAEVLQLMATLSVDQSGGDSSFSRREPRRKKGCGGTMTTVLSFGVGFGLITATVLLVSRFVDREDFTGGWWQKLSR